MQHFHIIGAHSLDFINLMILILVISIVSNFDNLWIKEREESGQEKYRCIQSGCTLVSIPRFYFINHESCTLLSALSTLLIVTPIWENSLPNLRNSGVLSMSVVWNLTVNPKTIVKFDCYCQDLLLLHRILLDKNREIWQLRPGSLVGKSHVSYHFRVIFFLLENRSIILIRFVPLTAKCLLELPPNN